MKNKIIKIIFLLAIIMLFTGCGEEETVFDTMSFSQTPINVYNPILEDEQKTITIDETSRNLYYERYEPTVDYVPEQIANTSYSKDELDNEIPNGLINFDFNRTSLRTLNKLVNDYNLAEEVEYKWDYKYKNEEQNIPKNYFELTESTSILGKPKDEESMIFDDLKISRFYDYTNANTIENLNVEINNGGTTEDVSKFADDMFSLFLLDDIKSILINSPNTSDNDDCQIFSGSVLSEDKESSYAFYREYKTPLKDSLNTTSAIFDLKFLDNYTQKKKNKLNIINSQDLKINKTNKVKIDFGEIGSNYKKLGDFFSVIDTIKGYVSIFPKSNYKYSRSTKEYDKLKTFRYDNETNLNPADVFDFVERVNYDTKFNYFGTFESSNKEKIEEKIGTVILNLNYEKINGEFSSYYFNFNDSMKIPKEGIVDAEEKGTFNIDDAINKKLQLLLDGIDIQGETFYKDYNKSLYTNINGLYCRLTVKVVTKASPKDFGCDIEVLIESPDIYTKAEYDIVSENSQIEYDLQGNIINLPDTKENFDNDFVEKNIDGDDKNISLNEDNNEDDYNDKTFNIEDNENNNENIKNDDGDNENIFDDDIEVGGNLEDFF